MKTIIDLLGCISKANKGININVLLVLIGKRRLQIENIANHLISKYPFGRIRIYVHQKTTNSSGYYPHAKCLLIDNDLGYLGSANFTTPGMAGHFELGVALSRENVKTLRYIMDHLIENSELFKLAWDQKLT